MGTCRNLSRGGVKVIRFVRVELRHLGAFHVEKVNVASNDQPGGRR